jgi:hypothetical protein
VHVLLWLREMELLPEAWLEMEDFRDSAGKPLESLRYTSNNSHIPAGSHARRAALARRAKEEQQMAQSSGGGIGSFFSWGGLFGGGGGANNAARADPKAAAGGAGGTAVSTAPEYSPLDLYWLAKSKEIISLCNIPQLFEDSKYFRASTLAHLMRSLIVVSSAGTKSASSVSLQAFSSHILHEESAVFCLERLADVIEKNQARLNHEQQIQAEQYASASMGTPLPSISTPTTPASTAAPVTSPQSASTAAAQSLHLWSIIAQHFEHSIANVRNDPSCTFYIERLVVNLLRFSVRLVYSAETTSQLISLLALLLQLPKATFATLGQRIIAGTSLFLQTHGESIRSAREWEVVLSLLGQFKHHPLSAHAAFTTFVYAVDNLANLTTFSPLLTHLTRYLQPAEGNDAWMPVAPEAVISLLLKLHGKLSTLSVPEPLPAPVAPPSSLSSQLQSESASQRALLSPQQIGRKQLERERERTDLWLSSVQNFCNLVRSETRPHVRKAALDALSTVLLAQGVSPSISPLGWRICFEKLLLPLLEAVQKIPPEVLQPPTPPAGAKPLLKKAAGGATPDSTAGVSIFDVRLKSATLVFQSFLHHLTPLSSLQDFPSFWLMFVGSMKRLMQGSTSTGALDVHFTEGLKNLLLVMHSSGTFDAVAARTGQNVLGLTWTVIDSFRPELTQQMQEHIKATKAVLSRTVKIEPSQTTAGARNNSTSAHPATSAAAPTSKPAAAPPQQHMPSTQLSSSTLTRQAAPSSASASASSSGVAVASSESVRHRAASPIDFARLAPLNNSPAANHSQQQVQQQQQHSQQQQHQLSIQPPPPGAASQQQQQQQFLRSQASQFQPISPVLFSQQSNGTQSSAQVVSPHASFPVPQQQQKQTVAPSLFPLPQQPQQQHPLPTPSPPQASQPGSEQPAQQQQQQQHHLTLEQQAQQHAQAMQAQAAQYQQQMQLMQQQHHQLQQQQMMASQTRPPQFVSQPQQPQQYPPPQAFAPRPFYAGAGAWPHAVAPFPGAAGGHFAVPPSLPGPLPASFPVPPPFPSAAVAAHFGAAMPPPVAHTQQQHTNFVQQQRPPSSSSFAPMRFPHATSNGHHAAPPQQQQLHHHQQQTQPNFDASATYSVVPQFQHIKQEPAGNAAAKGNGVSH